MHFNNSEENLVAFRMTNDKKNMESKNRRYGIFKSGRDGFRSNSFKFRS